MCLPGFEMLDNFRRNLLAASTPIASPRELTNLHTDGFFTDKHVNLHLDDFMANFLPQGFYWFYPLNATRSPIIALPPLYMVTGRRIDADLTAHTTSSMLRYRGSFDVYTMINFTQTALALNLHDPYHGSITSTNVRRLASEDQDLSPLNFFTYASWFATSACGRRTHTPPPVLSGDCSILAGHPADDGILLMMWLLVGLASLVTVAGTTLLIWRRCLSRCCGRKPSAMVAADAAVAPRLPNATAAKDAGAGATEATAVGGGMGIQQSPEDEAEEVC
ncbi:hypothetical protein PAPYR_1629 [Paratrimastix pyriformis]|uniref:Uncharacterized protein n=1 Tax=Paratrimastix pyriformis TaxID=342808 RepID=A0ABQ8UX40_9EUKA|nr:hypothetical protein PAPYR_1629 [Paratrimastix pyriformis]